MPQISTRPMTTSMTMSQMTISSSRVPLSVSRLDTTADTRSSNTLKRVFSTSALVSASNTRGSLRTTAFIPIEALATGAHTASPAPRWRRSGPRAVKTRVRATSSPLSHSDWSRPSRPSAAGWTPSRPPKARLFARTEPAWCSARVRGSPPASPPRPRLRGRNGHHVVHHRGARHPRASRRRDGVRGANLQGLQRASALSSTLERKLGLGDGRSNRSRMNVGSSGSACAKNIASTSTSSAANGSISHDSSKSRVANRSSSAVKPQNTTMPYSKKTPSSRRRRRDPSSLLRPSSSSGVTEAGGDGLVVQRLRRMPHLCARS